MNVDGAGESQARNLARKKKEVEDEQNALELDRATAVRNREKEKKLAFEKTNKDIVEISKSGEQQMDMVTKMNSERVRSLNENTQKNFEKIAQDTASGIALAKNESVKMIDDLKRSNLERVQLSADQAQSPFYRINSLSPVISEAETAYTVKIAMPEEEAKNLFMSGNGTNTLKISLARKFQDTAKFPEEARSTKTSNFQTIVETLNFTEAFDSKGLKKEYADGVVTISLPKLIKPNPTL